MVKKNKILEQTRYIGNKFNCNLERLFTLPYIFKFINRGVYHAKRLLSKKFASRLLYFFSFYARLYMSDFLLKQSLNYFYVLPYYSFEKLIISRGEDFEKQSEFFSNFSAVRICKNKFSRKFGSLKFFSKFSGDYVYFLLEGLQFKPNDIKELCESENFDKKYFEKTALLRGYSVIEFQRLFSLEYFNVVYLIFLSNLLKLRQVIVYLLIICKYI